MVKKSRGLKAVQKSKPRLEMIQRGKNFKKIITLIIWFVRVQKRVAKNEYSILIGPNLVILGENFDIFECDVLYRNF